MSDDGSGAPAAPGSLDDDQLLTALADLLERVDPPPHWLEYLARPS